VNTDEIIRMAREAGLICESRPVTAWMESTDLTPYLTRFAALVAANERSIISKTFWGAVNSCITTDELGIEFMNKFYPVHIFGHWLDRE